MLYSLGLGTAGGFIFWYVLCSGKRNCQADEQAYRPHPNELVFSCVLGSCSSPYHGHGRVPGQRTVRKLTFTVAKRDNYYLKYEAAKNDS
jgi:hypothetical protein